MCVTVHYIDPAEYFKAEVLSTRQMEVARTVGVFAEVQAALDVNISGRVTLGLERGEKRLCLRNRQRC